MGRKKRKKRMLLCEWNGMNIVERKVIEIKKERIEGGCGKEDVGIGGDGVKDKRIGEGEEEKGVGKKDRSLKWKKLLNMKKKSDFEEKIDDIEGRKKIEEIEIEKMRDNRSKEGIDIEIEKSVMKEMKERKISYGIYLECWNDEEKNEEIEWVESNIVIINEVRKGI